MHTRVSCRKVSYTYSVMEHEMQPLNAHALYLFLTASIAAVMATLFHQTAFCMNWAEPEWLI